GHVRVSFTVESVVDCVRVNVPDAYTTSYLKLGNASNLCISKLSDMRVKVLIGCNVPKAHKVIEQRFRSETELYATRTSLGWAICGPLFREHRKYTKLKANHDIETMIRDMYNEEFKDNARLEKEWLLGGKVLACNRDLVFKRLQKLKARFKTSCIVDDCLASFDETTSVQRFVTVNHAAQSMTEFRLTKFISRTLTMRDLSVDAPLIERTLGLQWNAATDTLRFVVNDLQWIRNLSWITNIYVPRSLKPTRDYQIIDLHVLSDASGSRYEVIMYICSKVSNKVDLRFLFGKARVALINTVTIHRLELSAASMAIKIYTLIREVTDKDQWRHVPSRLNPVDLASGGTNLGPFFLKEPEDNWPNREEPTVYETSLEYVKYLKVMYGGGHYNSSNEGRLTIAELRSAETVIVKAKLWKAWELKGHLECLNPIVVNEVVFIGGRLNGSMSPKYRHPIILPRDHPTSHLIIRHHHGTESRLGTTQVLTVQKKNAHLGQQLM
ncbi:Pol polyprotein, partial [Schistosoma japonicum]